MGGWLAGSNENITISTQVKVVVEVGVELAKIHTKQTVKAIN